MPSFHEVRFPTDISYGAVGGPGFMTELLELRSGAEQRNISWSRARGAWDVAKGLRSQADLDTVLAFFYARNGRGYGFRFKDNQDWKSCSATNTPASTDCALKNTVTGLYVGDGVTATFQLVKVYSDSANSYERTITKPVAGAVLVSVNGVTVPTPANWTIDTTTGIVTFTGGNIPPAGQNTKWGGEFDVPVRFDTDQIQINLETYNFSIWGQIPIKEIKM